MPLLTFDILEGRSDDEITSMLDAAHDAMLEAFAVPKDDRYQIVNEHKSSRLILLDTGLGITRSDKVVVVRVTTRPRTTEAKQRFYSLLTELLKQRCGIEPSDVIVSISVNSDEDWSFGLGRAQFLVGEL